MVVAKFAIPKEYFEYVYCGVDMLNSIGQGTDCCVDSTAVGVSFYALQHGYGDTLSTYEKNLQNEKYESVFCGQISHCVLF